MHSSSTGPGIWIASRTPAQMLNWVAVASPMRDTMSASPADRRLTPAGHTTGDNNWGLVPDPLPDMEYAPTSAGEVVRIDTRAGKQADSGTFPEQPLTLPPGTSLHILLDRKTLTTAFPILTVFGW